MTVTFYIKSGFELFNDNNFRQSLQSDSLKEVDFEEVISEERFKKETGKTPRKYYKLSTDERLPGIFLFNVPPLGLANPMERDKAMVIENLKFHTSYKGDINLLAFAMVSAQNYYSQGKEVIKKIVTDNENLLFHPSVEEALKFTKKFSNYKYDCSFIYSEINKYVLYLREKATSKTDAKQENNTNYLDNILSEPIKRTRAYTR